LVYNRPELAATWRVSAKPMKEWIKSFYESDPVAQRAQAQPERGFTINDEGLILFQGRIYIPQGARREFVRE
jgi:hypothetical protein